MNTDKKVAATEKKFAARLKAAAKKAKENNFATIKTADRDGFTNVNINMEEAYGDIEIVYGGRRMILQIRNEGTVPSIDIFPCGEGDGWDEKSSFAANIYADAHLDKPVASDKNGYVPVIRQMILFPNKS